MTTTPAAWSSIACMHPAPIDLPRELSRLYDLSYNLWWTWSPRARRLFYAVDPRLWTMYRNPVQLLIGTDRARWRELLEDDVTMALYAQVVASFDRYLEALDPSRSYFLRSDIDEFEVHADRIEKDIAVQNVFR